MGVETRIGNAYKRHPADALEAAEEGVCTFYGVLVHGSQLTTRRLRAAHTGRQDQRSGPSTSKAGRSAARKQTSSRKRGMAARKRR